jgi:putative ABC transport system substrate-binding protein
MRRLKHLFNACLVALAIALLFADGLCRADDAARTYRLLILDSQQGTPYDDIRSALLSRLKQHGYQEHHNLQVSLQFADNDIQQAENILRTLANQHFDVIVAGGTVATIATKNLYHGNIQQPVIFAAATDPVGMGLISDFNVSPVSNFTGVSYPVPVKSRFKFIRRLLPAAKTLGLVYADMPQSQSYNQWLQTLLADDPEFADLKIIFSPVPFIVGENADQQMADAAIERIRMLDSQVDAFIKPNDQMGTRKSFSKIVYQTASKPLIGIVKDDVMAHWGATAVVYPSHASIGEQAADMVKQVFEGRPIADIPAEWPRKFGFAVDLAKAKQFNITVPVELLLLAGDNIVQ